MKQKLSNVFIVVLFVAALLYILITGVSDLTNKSDLHTVTIDGATGIVELEHSINGLIPIGTDYYYLGVEYDTSKAYIIQADKNWLKDNFTSDLNAKNTDGVKITALSKDIPDYDVKMEIRNRSQDFVGLEYPLGEENFLDLQYRTKAILNLVLFGLLIVVLAMGTYIVKTHNDVNKKFIIVFVVCLIAAFVIFLKAM